jgi:hypothetical protein
MSPPWHRRELVLGEPPATVPSMLGVFANDTHSHSRPPKIGQPRLRIVKSACRTSAMLSSIGHSGMVDFSLFDERLGNGPDSKVLDPKDDSQLFSRQVSLLSLSLVCWHSDLGCA